MVKYFREMIGHVIRFKLERKEIQPENVPLQSQLLNTSAGILNVNPQHSHSQHKIIIHRRSLENAATLFFP